MYAAAAAPFGIAAAFPAQGGRSSALETGTKLYISNLDYGVSNEDIKGGDVGTQYRSEIYFYSPEQEQRAKASLEKQQKILNRKIVTEILPAKKFYRAEEYHQQYLAKGGQFGFRQSTDKGCNDPIRCYG
ncbi:peptide-methionine (S)-S-oxide reductase [Ranunculus cassubicifolius]